MGIKHFFKWFRNQFADNVQNMKRRVTFEDLGIEVDNFMIDLNGIFHGSAQKIYEYGEFKAPPRLMNGGRIKRNHGVKKQVAAFADICTRIEYLKDIVNPRKRLILCIDGPAPLSKQNQQRQRRFRSAQERDDNDQGAFDSNSITPGTQWMDHLSKYIDWYIRKRISEDPSWAAIEVVFSNEKCPGEGEHKIINYIRLYGNPEESYCIHGADADLIMLSLGTHYPNFYILRDDLMGYGNDFFAIDIGGVRQHMGDILYWPGEDYDPRSAINDFILMCFMVGNDFLPHIPGIAIIHGSIDQMIDVYKTVAEEYGHLTEQRRDGSVRFVKSSLKAFIGTLSQYEKGAFQEKLAKKDDFFPSPILENNAKQDADGNWNVDIVKYRQEYYDECLPDVKDMENLVFEYLEGMQWVLSYYTRGVPNWKWRYPFHYAPFCYTLAEHIDKFNFPVYAFTKPTTPFIQLLSVLPPKSADLIPRPLNTLLTDEKSPLKDYCPEDFEIDLSGCRQEWEATVILPMIDYSLVEKEVLRRIKQVDKRDIRRNILGKSFIYRKAYKPYTFRSYYGDFQCNVSTEVLEGI